MTDQNEQQIFPSKKKPKKHHGHHGGAWKVAYADFVTAMMALFIVLWILGQSEEVKKSVASYFQDPSAFRIDNGMPKGNSKKDIIAIGVSPKKNVKDEMEAKQTEREKEKRQFEETKGKIISELKQNPSFKDLMDQIEFTMTDEGLRIEMLESVNNVFFEIGSAKLNRNAEEILQQIGKDLTNLPNKVVVEGHTDSRKYIGQLKDYDNFDLSAERANSAKLALEKGGVEENQIDEIRGYADKRLRNREDPFSIVNRRISIILKYL